MRKWMLWAAMAIMAVSLTACEAKQEEEPQKEQQTTEENDKKEEEKKEEPEEKEPEKKEPEESKEPEVQEPVKQNLTVYFENANAEVESKQVEITELTPENVWNELRNSNQSLASVSMLSCDVRQNERKIDLNVSAELGEYLRSTGTAGETSAITAIVNTYLDAFDCDEIKILDNGSTLVSNHKEYNNYLKRR